MMNTNAILLNSNESETVPIIEPKKIMDLKPTSHFKEMHQHLLDACLQNDAQAQKQIYQLYSVALFNTCKRMLANRDDAQDVLQETFIDAFKGIKNFNGKSTFGAWIKKIAINKCINHLKRQKAIHFERLSEIHEGEFVNESEYFEINIQAINEAILKLPAGCRMIFVLKAMEGYDHKEIANEMRVSIGTSKSQYNRAKQLLQHYLKEIIK